MFPSQDAKDRRSEESSPVLADSRCFHWTAAGGHVVAVAVIVVVRVRAAVLWKSCVFTLPSLSVRVPENSHRCLGLLPPSRCEVEVACSVFAPGPRLVTQESRSPPASDSVLLTPQATCEVGKACTLQFDFHAPGTLTGSLSLSGDIWGVQTGGAFIAIKASCLSADASMVGPFPASASVFLDLESSSVSLGAGVYEICYCSTSAPPLFGLTSREERAVADCQDARGFAQLVGTLALKDSSLSTAFANALQLPLGLPPIVASSELVVQHSGRVGSVPASFCGWQDAECVLTLKKGTAMNGLGVATRPVSLVFKPTADPPDLNTDICSSAVTSGSKEVSVRVAALAPVEVAVPVKVPESFFYAICESPGDNFLGLVCFRGRRGFRSFRTKPPSVLTRARQRMGGTALVSLLRRRLAAGRPGSDSLQRG